MVKLFIEKEGEKRTFIYSGDIGRWETPILLNPTNFNEADYIIMESTYGDRLHGSRDNIDDELAELINLTKQKGGNILIPSFAVERSQEVLYYLNKLLMADRIPHLTVFLDSPMAISITKVFELHPELFDEDMLKLMRQRESPFDFQGLKMTGTVRESKAINQIRGTILIIAGSGMCNAGRIKHHLATNISRPESAILFVGYQAKGTLGRTIVDGNKEVRILGRHLTVKAKVAQITGFSAHADKSELMRWLSSIKHPPRQLFVTHGEAEVAEFFGGYLRQEKGWQITVPNYLDEYILE
jgi:metallo-beta-lactamase family protein